MRTLSHNLRPETRHSRAFLVSAAKHLHRHGTPAHRLEDTLVACAKALGLRLQVLATPTAIELAFGGRRAYLIRADAGEAELGRLVELDAVISEVASGRLDPVAGRVALRKVAAAPPIYGGAAVVAAFGLASAGAARFFGGNLADVLISLGLGLGLGGLSRFATARAGLGRVLTPLAAFLAALASLLAARWITGVHEQVTILSALIVLVPGLSLTLAMTELATRHLVSGTARLAGSLTVFMTMAFGVAVARAIVEVLPIGGVHAIAPWLTDALPAWTRLVALGLAPIGFCVLFQARRADIPAIAATGILASELARFAASVVGSELGAFAGAFAVALAANGYAAWRRLPAAVILLPCLLLLVPGALGFQSVTSFMADDALAGIEAAFRMILVAASLVAGVLVANTVVLPHVRRPASEHRAA
ncbi:hypothetical protein DB30_01715 [Enhygromyxa salina]|uniref:Threonine/serine exporter family protein n=1 Tax=Enhygromyxa salina TaxID=215803 RepID=A0A0C2D4Y1_9BACT|nr:threonine/serine exporter family protein [Enhygromyxa salina]KIG18211.1 hypothetical protein DB30_01715 [Enhygromyxa salina]